MTHERCQVFMGNEMTSSPRIISKAPKISLVLMTLLLSQDRIARAAQPTPDELRVSAPSIMSDDYAAAASSKQKSAVHDIPLSKSYEHYVHNIPASTGYAQIVPIHQDDANRRETRVMPKAYRRD
jgi:hypothetical protein